MRGELPEEGLELSRLASRLPGGSRKWGKARSESQGCTGTGGLQASKDGLQN